MCRVSAEKLKENINPKSEFQFNKVIIKDKITVLLFSQSTSLKESIRFLYMLRPAQLQISGLPAPKGKPNTCITLPNRILSFKKIYDSDLILVRWRCV
jgi:hypothetical protein